MAAKMLINIHEALEYLENLDVSSEDDLSSSNILLGAGDEKEVAGPSVDLPSKRIKGKCIFVSLISF